MAFGPFNAGGGASGGSAAATSYSNTASHLAATTVQAAIDELAARPSSGLYIDKIYISTQPTKTAYKAGETFDPAGMVVKGDYNNGSQVILTGITITGYSYPTSALAAGTTKVTVSYTENGVTKTADVTISVTKTSVTIPTYSGSLTYNGSEQTPTFTNEPSASIATKSGDTAATNAGTSYKARFTLNDTNLYQWSDGSTSYKEVSWSIAKKTPTISVSPASVTLNSTNLTATATVTSDGDGTFQAPSSSDSSVATATISNKVVTVSHVNKTTGTATITVRQNAGTNYEAGSITIGVTAQFVTIYGAEWDGTSTTKWTRTDAAAGFTDPVPYVAGASTYGSPFDNLQPWAGMVKSERTLGTAVAIPKFYYKLTQTGSKIKVQIADGPADGFVASPLHMNRGDGKGERDIAYIGRYHCGATAYKSVSGQNPKNNVNRETFRSSIHALGSTTWMMDFAARFTLWLLYIVEFADWNSQATIGKGCGNNSGVQAMGYTDSMPYHTGTTQSSRDTYGAGTQYRNIEGLWDLVYDFLGCCYNDSNGLNIILNPANDWTSTATGGTCIGKPSSGWPGAFTVSTAAGFPMFYASATGGSETTYSCDDWSYSASYPVVCVGGYYYQNGYHGLFFVNCTGASSTSASHGSRSMELP